MFTHERDSKKKKKKPEELLKMAEILTLNTKTKEDERVVVWDIKWEERNSHGDGKVNIW